jgi:hypothetical protein
MAPAYDIAELRRLRNSASDSSLALEKAVKEDVVKGTESFVSVQHLDCFLGQCLMEKGQASQLSCRNDDDLPSCF